MNGYVVYRVKHGKTWSEDRYEFVTPPGSDKSFTTDLMKARRYPTEEAAQADCCVENERVSSLASFLQRLG